MGVGEAQPLAAEREQPVQRRRVGPERRGTEQECLLAGPLVLVEQHHHQPGPAAEAAEHRALADACRRGDIVHRDRIRATLGDQATGGVEQQRAVARGIAPLLRSGYLQSAERSGAHLCTLTQPE